MSSQFPRGWDGTELHSACSHNTICNNSTGYDEMDDCIATEADKMIDIICEVDLNKD